MKKMRPVSWRVFFCCYLNFRAVWLTTWYCCVNNWCQQRTLTLDGVSWEWQFFRLTYFCHVQKIGKINHCSTRLAASRESPEIKYCHGWCSNTSSSTCWSKPFKTEQKVLGHWKAVNLVAFFWLPAWNWKCFHGRWGSREDSWCQEYFSEWFVPGALSNGGHSRRWPPTRWR